MKSLAAALFSALAVAAAVPAAQRATTANNKPLVIYVIDTEGGKAALYVSPTGQSLLIDSGNPGGRDTDRIMAAVTDAGVKQIDYLISTHYHVDHIGGMQELARRIPIAHFIDHGPTVEEREQIPGFQQAYAELYGKGKHTIVKPGDRVPITGVDWRIVTAGGSGLKTPLPGGGKPNAVCGKVSPKDVPKDENAQSVGSVITFGQFRAIDLGDLTWNNEFELMCPNNPIGTVDVYFVTHHGLDNSGSPAVVHGVRPRVAIMQNGVRKGAGAEAMPTMRSSPGLEDIWQLHWSHTAGLEQNSAGVFIANLDDPATIAAVLTAPTGAPAAAGGRGAAAAAAAHNPAYWIKTSVQPDGTFTVTNGRNGFSKTYTKRP
jgi:beta-lactamase superfamily II metal-dependent hydrolase